MPVVGKRFRDALVWAAELHEHQKRKGGEIPYVAHLIGVASIVLEHGGDEDQAIAALLHDALEDQAHRMTPGEIRTRFGEKVEKIVEACTNGDPEEQRSRDKAKWRARKQKYIDEVATKPVEALLVSMADKLYNARSILEDYREIGEALWPRFTTGKDGTLWYYRSLLTAFKPAPKTGCGTNWTARLRKSKGFPPAPSVLLLGVHQREELAPQRRRSFRNRPRITLLVIFEPCPYAAPVHAEVVGLHDDREAIGLHLAFEQVGELDDGLFLDLRARHDPLGHARVLREPDKVRVLVRHHADPEPAHDRAQVVRAAAAHRDRAHDHELVEVLVVREFGDLGQRSSSVRRTLRSGTFWRRASRCSRVLWSLSMSITRRLEQRLHLAFDFLEQRLALAGLHELGDVVVREKALVGRLDALTDHLRHRHALVFFGRWHSVLHSGWSIPRF